MGKTSDRESLIRMIANTIVHRIVLRNTNRPESSHFLESEVIEYKNQTERAARAYHWNDEDKKFIEEKSLQKIKEKMNTKYSDTEYEDEEADQELKDFMQEML